MKKASVSPGEEYGNLKPRGSVMILEPGGLTKPRGSFQKESANNVGPLPRKSGFQNDRPRASQNFAELEPIYDENSKNSGLSIKY